MIRHLDHIQLAMPAGSEDAMRQFYCDTLGMTEVVKPRALQGRGGFWAMAGDLQVHFGADPHFTPANKAHPAFVVGDLELLVDRLTRAGHTVSWDDTLPDVRRCFSNDPVGNRIEFIANPDPDE